MIAARGLIERYQRGSLDWILLLLAAKKNL